MTTGQRGPFSEDLQPRMVSGPPKYTSKTDRPVDYIVIADQRDVVIGFFYANDEDDAAGWQAHATASPQAQNGISSWIRKLRDAKARGIKPSAALDAMIRDHTDTPTDPWSHVVSTSRQTAANLASLRQLAGHAPAAAPDDHRGS